MINHLLSTPDTWEKLQKAQNVVLYGMGNGADAVLNECNRLGIAVKGVFASNGFVRGQQFRGFTVKKLSDLEKESGNLTVALCFATCLDSVMQDIQNIAARHPLLVPCVPVVQGELFNRAFVTAHGQELEQVYAMLADEESKRTFAGCVKAMYGGELSDLLGTITPRGDVFGTFFPLSCEENYYDLGAYRGDTVAEFLQLTGGNYQSITALEPDAKSFQKLCAYSDGLKNVTPVHACIFSREGTVPFSAAAGRQSAIARQGKEVPCTCVDALAKQHPPTYIKADVEGAEKEMLLGARETLQKFKPKLALCAYHRSEDIFALPLLVKSTNADYRIYLRRHKYIPCWETVFYCI